MLGEGGGSGCVVGAVIPHPRTGRWVCFPGIETPLGWEPAHRDKGSAATLLPPGCAGALEAGAPPWPIAEGRDSCRSWRREIWGPSLVVPTPASVHSSPCIALGSSSWLLLQGSNSGCRLWCCQVHTSPRAVSVCCGDGAERGPRVQLPHRSRARGAQHCPCPCLALVNSRCHQGPMAHPPPSIPHHLGRKGTSSVCLRALGVAGDPLPSWAGSPKVPSHVQWDQRLGSEGTQLHQS